MIEPIPRSCLILSLPRLSDFLHSRNNDTARSHLHTPQVAEENEADIAAAADGEAVKVDAESTGEAAKEEETPAAPVEEAAKEETVGEKRPNPADADGEDSGSPSKIQKVEDAAVEEKNVEPAGEASAEAPVAVEQ